MAQKDLIPFSKRTAEEKKRITSLGGKARQKQIKDIKTFKDACVFAMSMEESSNIKSALVAQFPNLEVEKITGVIAMTMAQKKKALDGDSEAFKIIRDTAGEKPVDKSEQKTTNQHILIIRADRGNKT